MKKMQEKYELSEKNLKEGKNRRNEGKSSLNKRREILKTKTKEKIKSRKKKQRQKIIILQPELSKKQHAAGDGGKQVPRKENNQ